jgi:hypothetical protein
MAPAFKCRKTTMWSSDWWDETGWEDFVWTRGFKSVTVTTDFSEPQVCLVQLLRMRNKTVTNIIRFKFNDHRNSLVHFLTLFAFTSRMHNQHNDTSFSSPPATPELFTCESPPQLRDQARTEASVEFSTNKLIVKSLASTEWQYIKFAKSVIRIKNYWVLPTPPLAKRLEIVDSI